MASSPDGPNNEENAMVAGWQVGGQSLTEGAQACDACVDFCTRSSENPISVSHCDSVIRDDWRGVWPQDCMSIPDKDNILEMRR